MSGIPYGLILLVAVVALAIRHARADQASARTKWAVGGVALASALASPSWPLTAAVVQLGVCVYMIGHRAVVDGLAESSNDDGAKVVRPAEPAAASGRSKGHDL